MLPALLLALAPLSAFRPVFVSGHSMEPSFHSGAFRIALRSWLCSEPKRGEVWVVTTPAGPSLKRVIGLPGERVQQRRGEVFVDDRRLEEAWIRRFDSKDEDGPWLCGEGYFLLGDNRDQSEDSRRWGALPRHSFRARIIGP
jgi:signal peptidase I